MNINLKLLIFVGLVWLGVGIVSWIFPGSILIYQAVIGFISVLGLFLGLDLIHMIGTTAALPDGQFKSADEWKYFAGAGMSVVLCIEIAIIAVVSKIDLSMAMNALILTSISIIGLLIAGIQANKLATGIPPVAPPKAGA